MVEDLAAAIAFFVELGLELEGQATVEGEWADQLIGVACVRVGIAVLRTPDGHSRVELSTFRAPVATSGVTTAPASTPGIGHLTSVVDTVDEILDRLRPHSATSRARWRSTRTSTATATSAAPEASSSGWSRSSAERLSAAADTMTP